MGDLSVNFSSWEFSCSHCGKCVVHPELIRRLQALRDKVGPIKVLSGYRCPAHPLSHTTPTSQHISGKAADVRPLIVPLSTFYRHSWKLFGDGGIGLYTERMLHLDIGPQRTWGRVNGFYVSLEEAEKELWP